MKQCTLLLLMLSWTLSSCETVPLTPGGEKARVLSAAEVQRCAKIGTTTATVEADIIGIPRHRRVIAEELTRLARNDAAAMGGDTVTPTSKIAQGRQMFAIYQCMPDF
jgi:hypothetical protein